MKTWMRLVPFVVGMLLITIAASPVPRQAGDNPNPPEQTVKLIFIHHSTGQAWLADDHGRLGLALRDNGYFVSDSNYGWGPDSIGDNTDIGHWWRWFRSADSERYLAALYQLGDQNCTYSRLDHPAGETNEIIMFKSCFPNSALQGSRLAPGRT